MKKQKKSPPTTFNAWFKEFVQGDPTLNNPYHKRLLKQAFIAGMLAESLIISDIFKTEQGEQA